MEGFLGARSPNNRSLLDVNEDCEDKGNDKSTLKNSPNYALPAEPNTFTTLWVYNFFNSSRAGPRY
jgi:hypothetical protein